MQHWGAWRSQEKRLVGQYMRYTVNLEILLFRSRQQLRKLIFWKCMHIININMVQGHSYKNFSTWKFAIQKSDNRKISRSTVLWVYYIWKLTIIIGDGGRGLVWHRWYLYAGITTAQHDVKSLIILNNIFINDGHINASHGSAGHIPRSIHNRLIWQCQIVIRCCRERKKYVIIFNEQWKCKPQQFMHSHLIALGINYY